jgi:hypothetical protein
MWSLSVESSDEPECVGSGCSTCACRCSAERRARRRGAMWGLSVESSGQPRPECVGSGAAHAHARVEREENERRGPCGACRLSHLTSPNLSVSGRVQYMLMQVLSGVESQDEGGPCEACRLSHRASPIVSVSSWVRHMGMQVLSERRGPCGACRLSHRASPILSVSNRVRHMGMQVLSGEEGAMWGLSVESSGQPNPECVESGAAHGHAGVERRGGGHVGPVG